jgi:hypothetical protein
MPQQNQSAYQDVGVILQNLLNLAENIVKMQGRKQRLLIAFAREIDRVMAIRRGVEPPKKFPINLDELTGISLTKEMGLSDDENESTKDEDEDEDESGEDDDEDKEKVKSRKKIQNQIVEESGSVDPLMLLKQGYLSYEGLMYGLLSAPSGSGPEYVGCSITYLLQLSKERIPELTDEFFLDLLAAHMIRADEDQNFMDESSVRILESSTGLAANIANLIRVRQQEEITQYGGESNAGKSKQATRKTPKKQQQQPQQPPDRF